MTQMEEAEGIDKNENDHKLENENSESDNENIHEAPLIDSSEELFKPPLHNEEETAIEGTSTEPDTQSGGLGAGPEHEGGPSAAQVTEEAEERRASVATVTAEAEPTEPGGDGEHDDDRNDPDISSVSLVLEDDDEAPRETDPPSREDSVGSESPGEGDRETPEQGASSNGREEEDGCEEGAYAQLYYQLCAEREEILQHSGELQTKIAENLVFWKDTGGDGQPEEGIRPLDELQQIYETYLTQLGDLKKAQAEIRELQTQELQQQVESEWRDLVALKRHTAMTAPGPQAARAGVDEVLGRERKCMDELVATKMADVQSKRKSRAQPQTESVSDMLQMVEQRKERQLLAEKCDEDLRKIRKNYASTMQVTVHIRESLQWIQAENQAKSAQLAHWEGLLAQKRELLTGAKRACSRLRSRALDLRQRCGMLGNVALLRDFEEQVDACGHLEGDEGSLRQRHSEAALKCARWKTKLGKS
ncbi:cilia- and flagella-associated protein 184 [Gadus morhua]|uniref:CCDC113/CCDC96 coiled-coil domain-containing protein n=1 Tax=Gadus morhua TaxID=8049 RepID=A0A8C5FA31_GADMO|nr:coiled-coil domain-containing protein 96 [Gadus morhua]